MELEAAFEMLHLDLLNLERLDDRVCDWRTLEVGVDAVLEKGKVDGFLAWL